MLGRGWTGIGRACSPEVQKVAVASKACSDVGDVRLTDVDASCRAALCSTPRRPEVVGAADSSDFPVCGGYGVEGAASEPSFARVAFCDDWLGL